MTTNSFSSSSSLENLRRLSLSYSEIFYDPDVHLVVNPPGTETDIAPPGGLHLIPNSCWYAYGLLSRARRGTAPRSVAIEEAQEILSQVLSLQLDAPGKPWHGTFRRFYEWPISPPDNALEWWDYDPNWREFVACAFAMIVEEFEDDLPPDLMVRLEESVAIAIRSEPRGRIAPGYTNPRLMHLAASAWLADRRDDAEQFAAAETELARISERHRELGGRFDEFNSPTYDGISLLALSMMCELDGSPSFKSLSSELRESLWTQVDTLYVPKLGNLSGPYSRAYFADMNMYVALVALWVWARTGIRVGPSFEVDPHLAQHGHDIMVGPLIADLAERWGPAQMTPSPAWRDLDVKFGERTMRILQAESWSLGVETSTSSPDWVGSHQRMNLVVHSLQIDGKVGVVWARSGNWDVASADANSITLRTKDCASLQWEGDTSSSLTGSTIKLGQLTLGVNILEGGEPTWRMTHEGLECALEGVQAELTLSW